MKIHLKIPSFHIDGKITIRSIFLLYLISFFLIPNYAGIKISGLPLLTAQRFFLIVIFFWIFFDKNVNRDFISTVKKSRFCMFFGFWLVVCIVTAIYNKDINSFFGPFVDQCLAFYLFYFFFSKYYSLHDIVKIITNILWILCICGIIEQFTKFNFFTLFDTGTTELNTGILLRDEAIRIKTAYGHPLAYGMILLLFCPFCCYDLKRNKIYIFEHKILFMLIVLNMFLTGSRSCIALFFIEFALIFIFSDKQKFGNMISYFTLIIFVSGVIIFIFKNTELIQLLFRQFYYVIDEIFGTNYSSLYGGNSSINNSSTYRDILWNIFSFEEFSPFIGKGTQYKPYFIILGRVVESIDNFYINYYIKYGIYGILFYILFVFKNIKAGILAKNMNFNLLFVVPMILISINFFVVDEIGILRQLIALSGIMIGLMQNKTPLLKNKYTAEK